MHSLATHRYRWITEYKMLLSTECSTALLSFKILDTLVNKYLDVHCHHMSWGQNRDHDYIFQLKKGFESLSRTWLLSIQSAVDYRKINPTVNTMTTGKKESKPYEDLDHFYSVKHEQVNKPNHKLITVLSSDIGYKFLAKYPLFLTMIFTHSKLSCSLASCFHRF